MFKIKFLRNILLLSFAIIVLWFLIDILFIYPSFKKLLMHNAEAEATRVATHLASMLFPKQNELNKDSIPVDLSSSVGRIEKQFNIMKLKIFSPSGEILYSTDPKEIGRINSRKYFHEIVAKGNIFTKIEMKGEMTPEEEIVTADVVETYIPLMNSNRFLGAFEIYYDITGEKKLLDKLIFRNSFIQFMAALGFLITILIVLFRAYKDITVRSRLEAQLHQAQKMEAIGLLAGGIAHDFNNILTAIMGYGNLLQTSMQKESSLSRYADEIIASSEKAATLVQSLLAFSRQQVVDPKPVDVNEIIETIYELLSRIIGEDIELKTVTTEENVTILADRGQMEQVLMNLATNARDAMPNGGILLIETERAVIDKKFISTHGYGLYGEYAVISVSDSGIGIDEKTRENIFEPFFTTKDVGKGTGLGLAMVFGIIKQNNGYIDVYSEIGKGTTFKIYLPLRKLRPEKIKPKDNSPLQGGNETILIAEDDEAVRTLTQEILKKFGYTVIVASNGQEAINKFIENKEKIDVLILDIIMPIKNGMEAYAEIKEIRFNIKALFFSGYTENLVHKKWIIEQGLSFISKPVLINDLLIKVRAVLDK